MMKNKKQANQTNNNNNNDDKVNLLPNDFKCKHKTNTDDDEHDLWNELEWKQNHNNKSAKINSVSNDDSKEIVSTKSILKKTKLPKQNNVIKAVRFKIDDKILTINKGDNDIITNNTSSNADLGLSIYDSDSSTDDINDDMNIKAKDTASFKDKNINIDGITKTKKRSHNIIDGNPKKPKKAKIN